MESPDRLQCRAYMVAALLRQMALVPEFLEQVMKLGSWNPERAIGAAGVGDLPAPTALNPLTELFIAVEQVRVQLSRNPKSVQLLKNLGVHFYGLVMDSQPEDLLQDATGGENTNPHAPKVSQVTLDAIDIIGRLILDARRMLMHRKNCPINICGQRAPVALQHHSEGAFQAIVPAANKPLRLTSFNIAVADFFGATNVKQQLWTDIDIEPIKQILMEHVLKENGNLQDLGAEVAQPNGLPVRAEEPEASRAVPVQIERRRAQSAPPGLLDELSVVQVVQPIADARVPSHTASVDAAQGSPGRPASGSTPPVESARGTSPGDQGSFEGSKTLAPRTSTPVAQQGSSDIGKLGGAAGLPVDNEQTGSTGDAVGVPVSSVRPVSQEGLEMTMDNGKEDGADFQKMDEGAKPISSPRDGKSIDPHEVARGSGNVPIDKKGSPAGAEPTADYEMPMEVEQEDRNLVSESPVLNSVSDTRIQNRGTGGFGNAPIDDEGSPAGTESVADLAKPMEIDQDDQNRADASAVPIAVTNTVLQNGSGTSSSSSSGQGLSTVVDVLEGQGILDATQGLPVRGPPVSGLPTSLLPALPMPGSAPLASQAPTPMANPVRTDGGSPALQNVNEDSVGSAEEGTSQDTSEKRKQRTPRRYTPGPPPASEQDATVQTNTRKPGRPRKHRLPPASGSSRAGQGSRSRSPPARQASHPLPTYQKITKDREARFQKKKTIFLATRETEHHPGSEIHGRKVAEAEMHCSESEVYNHPKLLQIMPHIHTLLFDLSSTGPLPQLKTVKEVKAEELFLKWNLEVNGEDSKFEWKELIRKRDPAYEEWWGLAVKVDKEQLEQMELGWITGSASDFGIGEEEDVARPSGRDYREFSPEL